MPLHAAMWIAFLAISGLVLIPKVHAQPSTSPRLSFTVTGPEQTVYSYAKDRCGGDDLPDAATRAFRDSKGMVHLLAPAPLNRAMVGPDLDHLRKNCSVVFQASKDPDPSHFDDEGWLESFYTENGTDVFALVSMDYHPDRHQGRCGQDGSTKGACWYATITQVKSGDGGYNFASPGVGDDRFVAGPRQAFSPDFTGTAGALVPSNIINFKGAYYTLISVAADAEQPTGECLMRATDLHDVKSWRAWDGQDFNVRSTSPYKQAPASSCVRLHDIRGAVRSLSIIKNGFVAVLIDQGGAGKKSAVVAQTSTDLVHWSAPVTVMEIAVYHPNGGAKGDHAYYYPSLIDGTSKSLNFDTIGSTAYLYLTKYTYGAGANRDIVRFPLHVDQQ